MTERESVMEGLRTARAGLVERNVPLTAGYYVAVVDAHQAERLKREMRDMFRVVVDPLDVPAEVRKVLGNAQVVAVLFGDLVVGMIRR